MTTSIANVGPVPAATFPSAASAARLLGERGPALAAAAAQVDGFQRRLDETERLLTMPRPERLAGCGRPLYEACWNQSTEIHKKLLMGICIGTLFAGAIGEAAVSLAGHPQLAGLIALGSLVGMFKGIPHAYAAIAKKWILPGQMDPLVLRGLERERDGLRQAVSQARAYKASLETEIDAKLHAPPPPAPTIQVEEAFVVIGGMKVPVRK
jgi:hypothetical protein